MEITNKPVVTNLLKKFTYCLAAFAGLPFFFVIAALSFININKANNTAEVQLVTKIITILYIAVPCLIVLAAVTWHVADIKKRNSVHPLDNKKLLYACTCLCRYLLAAIIMFYGLDKIMVNQLHMSIYWYGDELGKLSGTQLTWSFFGYSKIYNSIIALAQVSGGIMLLFRRTTLAGALFLLPILVNIALIDFNYDITAKDIISVLLFLDVFLIGIAAKPLFSFFVANKTVDGGQLVSTYSQHMKRSSAYKAVLIFVVALFAFATNYQLISTTQPTALQGAWNAVSVNNFTDSIPEKNRKLTLRLFVDGGTATVKKTYQYQDFKLHLDSARTGLLSLISSGEESNDITGSYELIGNDSLNFRGHDGKDSVSWHLKRYPGK